jgi:hypothetical protein
MHTLAQVATKLLAKTIQDEKGCLIGLYRDGRRFTGYGYVDVEGKVYRINRVIYAYAHGFTLLEIKGKVIGVISMDPKLAQIRSTALKEIGMGKEHIQKGALQAIETARILIQKGCHRNFQLLMLEEFLSYTVQGSIHKRN